MLHQVGTSLPLQHLTSTSTAIFRFSDFPFLSMIGFGKAYPNSKHLVLRSVHPSPLSAHRGFLGCGHFRQVDQFLKDPDFPGHSKALSCSKLLINVNSELKKTLYPQTGANIINIQMEMILPDNRGVNDQLTSDQYLRHQFLFIFILLQIVLFASYYYELVLHPPRQDPSRVYWGCVPPSERKQLLTMAGIAYIFNILFVMYFYLHGTPEELTRITYALGVYYALQLAFLPLLKEVANDRVSAKWVPVFLWACTIPFLFIAKTGWCKMQFLSQQSGSMWEILFVGLTTFIPVAHVIINDATRYGGTYGCVRL